MEKVTVFIKIRVLFWPEISGLGVFFNFDNERMRPPKYPSAPPPPGIGCPVVYYTLALPLMQELSVSTVQLVKVSDKTDTFLQCTPGYISFIAKIVFTVHKSK